MPWWHHGRPRSEVARGREGREPIPLESQWKGGGRIFHGRRDDAELDLLSKANPVQTLKRVSVLKMF